jgi:3-oxoacyl-[acyl-carrier protein] reductase
MTALAGRTAIVTGGARGIGAATARELARQGCDVAIADLRLGEAAEAVAADVRALGRKAVLVQADVAQVADCKRLVAESVAALGGLDILVNNAGGGFSLYYGLDDVTEEIYDRVVDINMKGAFFTAQAAAPHLRQSSAGRVINLGSELVYLGYEMMVPYCAAKGGIVAMTRAMARAFAPKVTVNAVGPGGTATENFKSQRWYQEERERREADILLGRFGEPHEIAAMIAFVAGPGGTYATGQTFNVNGGVVMP